MQLSYKPLIGAVVALAALSASVAQADVRITEVAPWGNGNTSYAADWFELTNTGAVDINITGWKMDDSSASWGTAVALREVSVIKAGQSVVFLESNASGSKDAQLGADFTAAWFGAQVPTDLTLGFYGGSGVGMSAGGDAVAIFNASRVLQAKVTFGDSPNGPVFATFDNAAGLNNADVSQLSVVGTHGAFAAFNDAQHIGSPGTVSAVPEPETYAMLLAGMVMLGALARNRQSK